MVVPGCVAMCLNSTPRPFVFYVLVPHNKLLPSNVVYSKASKSMSLKCLTWLTLVPVLKRRLYSKFQTNSAGMFSLQKKKGEKL